MYQTRLSRVLAIVCMTLVTGCGTGVRTLHEGTISRSVSFRKGYTPVDMTSTQDSIYLRIQGTDLDIDFNQCIIEGRVQKRLPDTFNGIALYIHDSKNVTIKNLSVHGFKIAILAENVENLQIVNCNLSYNYRPRLYSKWDRESLSDWLYFHNNEYDEWKRYGAAIYLKNCDKALVTKVTCQQGMNGLLMVGCEKARVYNNDISFNSGLGIGLYRSGHNRIMHNKLDWNVRGYSHGMYARGQDSAAILLYEQSSGNVIAFNSATHSGDGLFLWAGQFTMDTGIGGCDHNVIYRNDFSHSIANAIEVTFSSNDLIENKLNDSRYGVWGGYSHHTVIESNEIEDCDFGVAIEHGNHNVISKNSITNCPIGIRLWERETQPSDWPYAQARNVHSRKYAITQNVFNIVTTAISTENTDSVFYDHNEFTDVDTEVLPGEKTSLPFSVVNDIMDVKSPDLPDPLEDGITTDLPHTLLRGREYIIVNEWGPYNFQYPALVLRNKEIVGQKEKYTFAVFGPEGTWSLSSRTGFDSVSPTSGTFPDTIVAILDNKPQELNLTLEYDGRECIDQFGDTILQHSNYLLQFNEMEIHALWDVAFFQYDSLSDPLAYPQDFSLSLAQPALKTLSSPLLAFRWWGAPLEGVPADRFAVRATTDITVPAGEYTLQAESDDGIRIWLDGALILERWDVHTPVVDETQMSITVGSHHLEVEYFDAGGLAVLDVSIHPNVPMR